MTETREELTAGARRSRAADTRRRTASGPKAPVPVPLPAGFGIELDAGTKRLSDGSLFGGSPGRVLRLTAAGDRVLADLEAGPVRSTEAGALARRLTDAGLAHPVPPSAGAPAARASLPVTVIIPVRDRTAMLKRCLAALSAEEELGGRGATLLRS